MNHWPLQPLLTLAALSGLGVTALSAQTTAIRADRLLDVESGRIVTDALVVVQGDRIERVGGRVPPGATVIDLGDVTLMPGLMDAHTHLTMDIDSDWISRPVTETAADAALMRCP